MELGVMHQKYQNKTLAVVVARGGERATVVL
jgi:hypothetical protein